MIILMKKNDLHALYKDFVECKDFVDSIVLEESILHNNWNTMKEVVLPEIELSLYGNDFYVPLRLFHILLLARESIKKYSETNDKRDELKAILLLANITEDDTKQFKDFLSPIKEIVINTDWKNISN